MTMTRSLDLRVCALLLFIVDTKLTMHLSAYLFLADTIGHLGADFFNESIGKIGDHCTLKSRAHSSQSITWSTTSRLSSRPMSVVASAQQ